MNAAPVAVVIPAFNPEPWLLEAIASARNQSLPPAEIIVVDDGTTTERGKEVLRRAEPLASRLIRQSNTGPGGARNAGFRAATAEFVAPLDSDDLFERDFLRDCVRALRSCPEAAFAYPDYRVFGDRAYVQRAPEYNLYELLDANSLPYACVVRRDAWKRCGGYQQDTRPGYEDWDFWLRMGAHGCFGHHVPRALFAYRVHEGSQFERARERHDEVLRALRLAHPALYAEDGRASIKAVWKPAACIISAQPAPEQTIRDVRVVASVEDAIESRPGALVLPGEATLDCSAAEMAALAVWGGQDGLRLPDGSVATSPRRALQRNGGAGGRERANAPQARAGRLETIQRHLANAELNAASAWLRHPVRSAVRSIPLRAKEAVNRAAGRPVFDLSFYLKFQPRSILLSGAPVDPLEYIPRRRTKRRIAFITPHLGRGGAENVLLDMAAACDRGCAELFVIATHGGHNAWIDRWRAATDHIYDLGALVSPERVAAAIYSIAKNWGFEYLVVQNTLYAYSVLGALKQACPEMRVVDVVHASTADAWDIVTATVRAAPYIDTRVAISAAVRDRLLGAETAETRVVLIRNGIDLERFTPSPPSHGLTPRILFAGRLDSAKRPTLLADIARRLKARLEDFTFVVAGDGPEKAALQHKIAELGLGRYFDLRGAVEEMAAVMSSCDMLILPSAIEGVPLVALEAMACARPVIATNVGAVGEAIDAETGILVEKDDREVDGFVEAIARLAADPILRARLGQAGRSRVEREYDGKTARAAYRQLLTAVPSRRPL